MYACGKRFQSEPDTALCHSCEVASRTSRALFMESLSAFFLEPTITFVIHDITETGVLSDVWNAEPTAVLLCWDEKRAHGKRMRTYIHSTTFPLEYKTCAWRAHAHLRSTCGITFAVNKN